jgi:pimeloyl-ACP methyl ester carboxylesterase
MSLAAEYPFDRNYFEVGGQRMHYVDEGKGETLVFLHGNPTWSYYWRSLLKALRTRYRVIAPDHIGCGLSDKPQDYEYRLDRHVANVTALLDHLAVKNVTLLLHDWGGAIGMGYAVKRPENVKRFVLFNTAAFTSDDMPLRLSLCRMPGFGKLAIQGLNAFAWGATRMATTKGLSRDVRAGYLKPYDTFKNRIATYRFVQDIPLTPKHPSWNRLREIEDGLTQFQDRPMKLLWGKQDFVFHVGFLNEWCKRFPDAESHIFEDAGHYVVEDAGDRILPLVEEFLERT